MAKTKNRMRLSIPDDFDAASGNWNIAMFCYPDSPKWRGIIRGAFYELTRGRKWDETTGSIKFVQTIAHEIVESLSMGCNTELTRIADAIEALNPDNQRINITDIIDAIANDPLGTFTKIKPILDTMKSLQDLIPGFETKINPVDLAGLLVDAVSAYNNNRHNQEMVHLAQVRLMLEHGATFGTIANTVLNLLPGGTIADALTDTDEYIMLTIDTLIQAFVGTSTVSALMQIKDAISNKDISGIDNIAGIVDEIANINTNAMKLDELVNITSGIGSLHDILSQIATIDTQDELATISNVLNNINTSLAPLSQLQYLDNIERAIRSSCGDGSSEYIPDEWDDSATYFNYKCRASNFIYDLYENIILAWKQSDWNVLLNSGIGFATTGLVSYATPLVAAAIGISLPESLIAAIAGFVAFLIFGQATFDPNDMYTSLTINKETIIRSLYNATSTEDAEAAFINSLTMITDVEKTAFAVLITQKALAVLFDNSLPASYTPQSPIVCTSNPQAQPLDKCGLSTMSSLVYYGYPKTLVTGDIISSGTLTAEYIGIAYKVFFSSRLKHRITITSEDGYIVNGSGAFTVQDCINDSIVETSIELTALPVTVEGYKFYTADRQTQFSITFTAEVI